MSTLHHWLRTSLGLVLSLAIALTLVFGSGSFYRVLSAPLPASQQVAKAVRVELGSSAGDLKFFPSELTFVPGKRYKLILTNPSSVKHYFTAKDFADAVWTQKVEAGDVEIKGAIHELELKPGAEAEWVFVPEKPGSYPLRCVIPGHTEAGMVGTINIT